MSYDMREVYQTVLNECQDEYDQLTKLAEVYAFDALKAAIRKNLCRCWG